MGWVNNGTARSLKITVDKQVGGNQAQGYTITYNGQLAGSTWGNPSYLALTDEEMQQLSAADFTTRYNDFVAYVESIEAGLDFTTDIVGDGATKYDPTVCLSTTTTTVYVPPPVYAFAIKYGTYSNDVCTGTSSIVYSSVQVPVVGTILYTNATLTSPWTTSGGEHILFVSPVIYEQFAVQVSITTGAIVAITTFDCGAITPVWVQITAPLGWGATINTACSAATGTYYGNNANFALSTTISATSAGLVTLGGYYSDGTNWKYTSDGTNFILGGACS